MGLEHVAIGESARIATQQDISWIEEIRQRHLGSIDGQRGAELLITRELVRPGPLSVALGDMSYVVVVGTYDDVVFGYGIAAIERLNSGTQIGRLTEFLVDQEIRKSGVGEAMMDLVVEVLKERGCSGIDSQALPGDRNTKNFFESFGLKARLLTVHRAI